jgi:hypothetical protein
LVLLEEFDPLEIARHSIFYYILISYLSKRPRSSYFAYVVHL